MFFLTQGEKLKAIRKELKVEQRELEEAGVSRNFISMCEWDRRKLGKETAKKIAKIFNRKAKRLGVSLKVTDNYFLSAPEDDARAYCDRKIQEISKIEELQELLDIANEYKLEDITPKLYLKKGDLFFESKNYSEAFEWYIEALEEKEPNIEYSRKPYIYNQMGRCRAKKLDDIEAVVYFTKSYEFSRLLNNREVERYSLYNMCKSYRSLNNIKKAQECVDKFLTLTNEQDNCNDYIYGTILKSSCNIDKGEYNDAINTCNSILHLIPNTSDPIIAYLYDNLAKCHVKLNNLELALDYFKKSECVRENYDKSHLYFTLINKSSVYMKEKQFKEAAESVNKGISSAIINKDSQYALKGYRLLEKIYKEIKEKRLLEAVYMDIIKILGESNNKSEILKVHIKLSLLNLENGDENKGRDYLNKAITI